MKVAGINQGPTGSSRGILHQAKGDHLYQVHSYQKVLNVIRWGRLVLVIGGQESQNLLKGPSGLSPLRSDGSRDGQVGGWATQADVKLKGYTISR
jgi:hypothetical protein